MVWWTLCAVLITAAFLSVILKASRPEYALGLSLLAGIAVLTVLLSKTDGIWRDISEMLFEASLPDGTVEIVLRGLAIALITQMTADTCRDAGENGLAEKAELTGRVFLVILAVPLFRGVAQTALALLDSVSEFSP